MMALSILPSHAVGCTSVSTPPGSLAPAPVAAVLSSPSPPSIDARALALESLALHGSPDGHAPLTLVYRGKRLDLGHYGRPGELREYDHRASAWFGFDGRFRVQAELARDGEVYPGRIELDETDLYWLDYGETSPRVADERERVRARYRLAEAVPSLFLALALTEPGPLSYAGQRNVGKRVANVITFTDAAGSPRSIFIDALSRQVLQVSHTEADPLFGDDVQTTVYLEQRQMAGLLVPVALRRTRLWFVEDELSAEATAEVVEPVARRSPPKPVKPPTTEVSAIASRLFELHLPHLDNRTLFLELDDHVLAFEAPLTSATGDLILAEIQRTTRGKPVRALFISHHHPDYVGGIRPFVAQGATLVTTPGNVEYLARIAEAPRLLEPDTQSREPRRLAVNVVRGQQVFERDEYPVEVHDIGRYTGHTDEYLIYYFPKERILFEGDLVMAPAAGDVVPARPRAIGLLRAIDDLHLDVERIYESWPLHDRAPVLRIETLRRMVELQQREREARGR